MTDLLRLATREDISEITRIYNDAIQSRIATADIKLVSEKEKEEEFMRYDKSEYPLWVSEYCGKVIAFLCLKPFNERFGFKHTVEVGIYIDKNFQGQKLGQQFLNELVKEASCYKFENLIAFIFSDNTPSIKLFKKVGFKEWGRFPKIAKIDDNYKDILVLGRPVECE